MPRRASQRGFFVTLRPITALLPWMRTALLLAAPLALSDCGDSPVESTTAKAILEVTTVTTGAPVDPDGYSLAVDGGNPTSVGANAALAVPNLADGEHRLDLGGVASECVLAGANPRFVLVTGGNVAPVTFEVKCATPEGPPTGSIMIFTSTTGLRPDLDGYTVHVGGGPEQPIGPNATATIPGIPAGDVTLELSGVVPNCSVAGQNPRTASVPDGGLVVVTFEVGCLPDGSTSLLFTSDRSGTSHLYRIQEDGTRLVDLTPSMKAFDGDWSPDGSRIVFTRSERGGVPFVYTMNADGSSPARLGPSGSGAKWAPDGSQIVFQAGGMIKLMNADGSNLRDLAQGSRPDWSPDGTQIAFDRLDPSRCLFDMFCPVEIYVMAADGSQVRKLIGSSNASDQLTSPAWSPDGSRIAYSRRCCFLGPSVSGIYAVRPAGSVLQPIYQGAIGGGPIWSPDGTTIAFAAMRTDGITELTLIAQGARGTIASSPDSEYPEAWK